MNQDQIRRDQLNEGNRRTLSAKPGYNSRPAKKPFVAKGHDAILKGIQESEHLRISVSLIGDGTTVEGRLIARDKYTITILTDEGRRRTFYKHAIEGFEPVQVQ